MMRSAVSVVVPSSGRRPRLLVDCLKSIAAQEISHDTSVVAPPGRRLPKEVFELARVVEWPGATSVALNLGIRQAPCDVVAITNDDCTAAPGWLAEVTAPLEARSADLCAGQSLPARPGRVSPATYRLDYAEPRYVRWESFRPLWDLGIGGNNFALRKEVLGRVGPFNESLGPGSPLHAGEDIEMFHRALMAGLTICINPRAVILHEPLETWVQEARMMYTYRVGLAAYFYCHRKEPGVGSHFVRDFLARQVAEAWRAFRRGRFEQGIIELLAVTGLIVGVAKSPVYLRPAELGWNEPPIPSGQR